MSADTSTKRVITLRVTVRHPLPGVALCVQRGRDELLPPVRATADAAVFELRVEVKPAPDGAPTLRGPEVQGPPAARFLYVNAGRRAGQEETPWDRRAKVPLTTITAELLAEALRMPGAVIEAAIDGRSRDGGPSCATVPLLDGGWRVRRDAG